jgi:hypothetical protein
LQEKTRLDPAPSLSENLAGNSDYVCDAKFVADFLTSTLGHFEFHLEVCSSAPRAAAGRMRKHSIYDLLGLPVKLHASLQAGPSSLSEFV